MRRKYLQVRSAILQNRYNVHVDAQSNSACSKSNSLVSKLTYKHVNVFKFNAFTTYLIIYCVLKFSI